MDDLLKELNKFRGKFPKELVMYYPYPAQKEALAKGEIKLYRNDGGGLMDMFGLRTLKQRAYQESRKYIRLSGVWVQL